MKVNWILFFLLLLLLYKIMKSPKNCLLCKHKVVLSLVMGYVQCLALFFFFFFYILIIYAVTLF